jgi:hypothetical protein
LVAFELIGLQKEEARVAFESEARKEISKPQVSLAEQVVGRSPTSSYPFLSPVF